MIRPLEVSFVIELMRHAARYSLDEGMHLTALGKLDAWRYGLERGNHLIDDINLLRYDYSPG